MINWSDVKKGIYSWAKSQAREYPGSPQTFDFMWEDQSEHKLTAPYGTLKFITGPVRIFQDETRKEGNDFLNSGLREITLSVNLYGDKAFEVANFMNSGIERSVVLEMFQSVGLAYIQATTLRNLTRLVSARYESRFQFDVRFRIAENIVDGAGYFDKVEITNEFNNGEKLIDP